MAREPILMAAVGKKGVGKSYQTQKLMQSYVVGNPAIGLPGRHCLILDSQDEYSMFEPISLNDVALLSVHQQPQIRRIRPIYPDTGQPIYPDAWIKLVFKVLQVYRNGFLLIEDLNKFVGDYIPDDLSSAIVSNRHTGLDICTHFQAIGRLTPKIWQNLNLLRFHKNNESVDKHEGKFPDKYEVLKVAENMVNKEFHGGNERFCLFVDIDHEKIKGNFSRELFLAGAEDFVRQKYNTLSRSYSGRLDEKGKKSFTYDKIVEAEKQRLLEAYLM
jgi:hypothetical protein